MANIKVRLSPSGARAILTSPGVASELGRRAQSMCNAANGMMNSSDNMRNDAFMSDVSVGDSRARATVYTANPHGVRANAKQNILVRSINAGR